MIKDFIVAETQKIMKNALINFSKKGGIKPTENQLMICGGEDGTPYYLYLVNYKTQKEVTFNEILGVKFDFKQREGLATPFMRKSINRLAEEEGMKPQDVKILVFSKEDKCKEIFLMAYKEGKPLKQVTFEWLFEEGDLEEIM
jgi:hypothetical protein